MFSADLVTVYHNDENFRLHHELLEAVSKHETHSFRFIGVDNRKTNRGFAAACNLGAFHPQADAPVIGFLNPDVEVSGPFLKQVIATLRGSVVITGNRFGKSQYELDSWGVADWVCGATLFVDRKWFRAAGGFDEQFVWSWEETDLIRQAESQQFQCRSIQLPLAHDSPTENSVEDANYKRYHFDQGQKRFQRKWGRRRV